MPAPSWSRPRRRLTPSSKSSDATTATNPAAASATGTLRQLARAVPKTNWLPLLFVALALIVPLIGMVFVNVQAPQIERETYGNLQAIAQLRADQVGNWLNERYGNGKVLAASSGLMESISRLMLANTDGKEISGRFQMLMESYDYYSVILTNRHGQVLLSQGGDVAISPAMRDLVVAAMTSKQVQRSPLYRDEEGHAYQGYLFSRPLPLAAFEEFVKNGR